MSQEYKPWHQMKDLIKDPHDVSQKLRALWSQPDLRNLEAPLAGPGPVFVRAEASLIITSTILGAPYYSYSIVCPPKNPIQIF